VDAQQWADREENEAGSQEEGGEKGREVFDNCDSIVKPTMFRAHVVAVHGENKLLKPSQVPYCWSNN
jgi:hypothetical protein